MATSGRNDVFSTHEAARICRVTPMTVIRWVEEGKISAFKTAGGHRRIWRHELERFCVERGIPFTSSPDGPTVLVVSADADARTSLFGGSEVEAPRLLWTDDPFEAGRIVGTVRPDTIIVDERTPRVDPLSICRSVLERSDGGRVRVVVLCHGTTDAATVRAYEARGASTRVSNGAGPAAAIRDLVQRAIGR